MKLAETRLNNTLWQYRSFQADFKPQIQLNATLPGLNRSIDNIILPDGREDFVSRALMRNTLKRFTIPTHRRYWRTGFSDHRPTTARRF